MAATTEDKAERKAPVVVKTRKQKKEGSRVAKAKTSVEQMADASMVNLNDASHRDKGWWAIDTANPNDWVGSR